MEDCDVEAQNLLLYIFHFFGVQIMVPWEGIEPSLPKEHDFESCASTNSATMARTYLNHSCIQKK